MSGAKLEQIRTPTLSIACELSGPARGRPPLLLHGWPDDARTWDRVLPALHAAGHRTIVPYLRGCGPTRFRSPETPRNGQLAALGQDVLDLADAMELRSFAVVGHDWGALHPAAQGKRQEFPHGHLGVLQHVMHHRDGAEVVDGDADTFQGWRSVGCMYVCREERRHMTAPHRWLLCLLLVGVLLSCGGDGRSPGGGGTCLAITVTYNGSKSGPAYLRIMYSDGGHIFGSAPSIQIVMAAENGATHCVVRGPGDVPFTAASWIDVSGAGAANCADMSSPQCQPSPSDPQAHQSGVERYGQTTQIRLDVVDMP